jgi:hypothetical protein
MNNIVKVTFMAIKNDLLKLKAEAEFRNMLVTDMLRRAIANQLFIYKILRDGGKIIVQEKDGKLYDIIWR